MALHCKVVEVPLATLLFSWTRVTAGLASWLPVETEAGAAAGGSGGLGGRRVPTGCHGQSGKLRTQLNRRTTLAEVPCSVSTADFRVAPWGRTESGLEAGVATN